MQLPPALERAWHTHGYYGSVSHNTKAVYQRYLGWFDGNPAHPWEHPPVEAGRRYVDYMGGSAEVLKRARQSFADGDFRWVVQVVHHVLFAEPDNAGARRLQADALEQLGSGSENGTWRSFYLIGALELRQGSVGTPTSTVAPDLLAALTLEQLVDSLAIRVDGPRAWDADITVRFDLTDGEPATPRLRNGVLPHTTGTGPAATDPEVTITLDEAALRAVSAPSRPISWPAVRTSRSPAIREDCPHCSATFPPWTPTSPSSLPDPTTANMPGPPTDGCPPATGNRAPVRTWCRRAPAMRIPSHADTL
ncbi:alkyl sulfatase dimerization domain-containing protein [Streptomyces sp. NPDC086077]|uniref:alkyl sulfatase dimerization domain-containing protein n=1 Tax=Streptomyces sp. NPDC086077 TaxID=3154862 RepID=UPI00342B00E8